MQKRTVSNQKLGLGVPAGPWNEAGMDYIIMATNYYYVGEVWLL